MLFKTINKKASQNTQWYIRPAYCTINKAVLYMFNWLRIILFIPNPLGAITLKDKHIVFGQIKQIALVI
jgi:hypothetical protein